MPDRDEQRLSREPNPTTPGLQARRWKKIRDWFRTGVPTSVEPEEEDGPPTARDGK